MRQNEWSALQVLTGNELDVLRRVRDIAGVKALAPMERVMQMRTQRMHEVIRPLLPGYVLIRWDREAASYYRIRSIPGVIRFLGGGQPMTIPEDQMRVLLGLARHCEVGKPAPVIRRDGITYIATGPLAGLHPSITRVNRRAGRASLTIRLGDQTHTVTVAVDIKPDNGGG